jgi:hypothetical protein
MPIRILATAAAVVLMAGFSGGLASQWLLSSSLPSAVNASEAATPITTTIGAGPNADAARASVTSAVPTAPSAPETAQAAVTTADLERLSQRLREEWQADVNSRVDRLISHRPGQDPGPGAVLVSSGDAAALQDLRARMAGLERRQQMQTDWNVSIYRDLTSASRRGFNGGPDGDTAGNFLPASLVR